MKRGSFIDELHHRQSAYNLVYLPEGIYCTPRPQQGSVETAPWSSGFAWHEMMGSFSLFDHGAFAQLTESDLEQALAASGLSIIPDTQFVAEQQSTVESIATPFR